MHHFSWEIYSLQILLRTAFGACAQGLKRHLVNTTSMRWTYQPYPNLSPPKSLLTWMSFCVAFELCAVACSLCLLPVDLQNGQSVQGYVALYAHNVCICSHDFNDSAIILNSRYQGLVPCWMCQPLAQSCGTWRSRSGFSHTPATSS